MLYQVTREQVVAGPLPVDDEGDIVIIQGPWSLLEHEVVDFAVPVDQNLQLVHLLKSAIVRVVFKVI